MYKDTEALKQVETEIVGSVGLEARQVNRGIAIANEGGGQYIFDHPLGGVSIGGGGSIGESTVYCKSIDIW